MAEAGTCQPGDLGWYEGCIDWVALRDIPGIFDEADPEEAPAIPPPIPRPDSPPPATVPSDTGEPGRPWLRFAARMVDMILFSFLLGIVLDLLAPALIEQTNQLLGLVSLVVFALCEPFFLHAFGATPGKMLLNIRVTGSDGQPPTLPQAFSRSLLVWIFGIGMGLPILSMAAMMFGYFRVKKGGAPHWDLRSGTRVVHGPSGPIRMTAAVVVIGAAVFLAYTALQVAQGTGG